MSLERPEYVSDLVVYLLNRLGVEYVTLNPGATTRGMHESLVTYACMAKVPSSIRRRSARLWSEA